MVLILLSLLALVSVPVSKKGPCVIKEVKNQPLKNQNPSARSKVNLFSDTASSVSSSSSGTCSEQSSSSNYLLLIPLVWCLLALKFLQDPYLAATITCNFFFFAISTNFFMIFLIGSVINPVKSCTASRHNFLQQELVLGLTAFTAFLKQRWHLKWYSFSDFLDVLIFFP